MTSRHATFPISGAIIIETTTADLVITLVILVFLALLQLMHLIWCWTSNWARVAFACEYARYRKRKMEKEVEEKRRVVVEEDVEQQPCSSPHFASMSATTQNKKKGSRRAMCWSWWMRLKWLVVSRTNWFDKHLWQDKLGQHSLIGEVSSKRNCKLLSSSITSRGVCLSQKCARLPRMRGVKYIGQVFWDLFGGDTKKGATVRLDDEVKGAITKFLDQLKSDRIEGYWLSSLSRNGVDFCELPFNALKDEIGSIFSFSFVYTMCVMMWHIATCYCDLAEQEQEKKDATSSQPKEELQEEERLEREKERLEREKNRRVAITLSRYCVYLVVSAPELLPGPAADAKRRHNNFVGQVRRALGGDIHKLFEPMSRPGEETTEFMNGVAMGKRLMGHMQPKPGVRRCTDPWKALALVWVQILVFAAPYGEAEAHMRYLSRGGEFITHLWALLYHLGVRKWQPIASPDYQRYIHHPTYQDGGPEETRETPDLNIQEFVSLLRGAAFYNMSWPFIPTLNS
ncbi:hypothetical protein ACP70R_015112 [Stipagrostis hirtigluma subsp. patula]